MHKQEALEYGYQQLKHLASARLDSRLLLMHCLKCDLNHLISNPDAQIADQDFTLFCQLLARRINGEPISQILGEKEFYGINFKVSKDTLTPRPDSETIIDAILSFYRDQNQSLKVIDFGTGTGCLLLTILALYPNSSGVGVDISSPALEIAKGNAELLGSSNRAQFVLSNWGEKILALNQKFDIIISNPPYIESETIATLEQEVLFEPIGALDGGKTGLDCYQQLAPYCKELLAENGSIFLEFGINQEDAIASILAEQNLSVIEVKKDLAGINRCIVAGHYS